MKPLHIIRNGVVLITVAGLVSWRGGFAHADGHETVGKNLAKSWRECWQTNLGKYSRIDMIMEISIHLRRDGSVENVRIIDQDRPAQEEAFRKIVENTRKAIISCAPYNLPINLYSDWQILNLRFDPSKMSGQ